jgi:hypothetical protein
MPNNIKALFIIGWFVIMIYIFTFMLQSKNNIQLEQENYIKNHNCKLIETIPSRVVGMMIHGETYIYKCSDEKIVRVN